MWLTSAFGLRASRSQSPSRLTASTSAASVAPGKATIHQSPENRYLLPIEISVPSDGCVGQADAEERQRRLGDDGQAEIDGQDHQHGADHIGQDMAQHDQRRRQADEPGGLT
jgi:hypothetical protein